MRTIDRHRMAVNRLKWDESVPLHIASSAYDVPAFLRGRSTLRSVEIRDLAPVRGRSLLHLQCHFGLDTLSWARRGARATGVDFSDAAVTAARGLALESGLKARFVRSDVYELPRTLGGTYDIVYTAKGALCWLPDLDRWAKVVARFLAPGGRFYMLEDHPAADVYSNESRVRRLQFEIPYFQRDPQRDESDGTYATSRGVKMKHRISFGWLHPVSEVLNALLGAGLEIRAVHEYPFCYWKKFPFMRRAADGYWHLTRDRGMVPLMWSVAATKPR